MDPKLAYHGVEEATPLGIVGLGEIEDDGNMGTNVHRLESCGSGRGRVEYTGGGSGRGRRSRVMERRLEVEERIVVGIHGGCGS